MLVARNEDRLTALASRLKEAYDVDVLAVVTDLADFESVREQVVNLPVSIGLLVYDAAYAPVGQFYDVSENQLDQAAAVNVRTPLLLTKLLSAPMIDRGRGGIVLMSSLAGSQGSPNVATYAATKAFNTILAEGLWSELAPRGVDVLACTAGAILTPSFEQAGGGKSAPGALKAEVVAEKALNSLARGPIVIPGAVNKIGRFVLARLLSRRAAIALMSKNTESLS